MISQAIKTISSRGAFGIMLLLLSMTSCVKDYFIEDQPGTLSDIPEGMVKVGLYTNSGDYQTPVSRATANEGYNEAAMPWVFVFSGNDDNATFVEVKQAGPGGTSPEGPYVILTKQSSPVRLLIVANAPATFFNGASQVAFTSDNLNAALTGGTTFAQAVNNILNTAKLSYPSALPYEGAYIPMSGAVDLSEGIDKNTTIGTAGSKVDLRRVVAKVTVQNSASGFKLSSASVAGAKQYGRLYQGSPVLNIAGNITDYGAGIAPASTETTLANPIYIYESAAGETSVIISGIYNGNTYYYKLAFKDPTDGSVMAVRRNMWYQFKITSVAEAGYSSFSEAVGGSPSNIAYTIEVIDQSSFDMLDNGQYYLGLSNSEYLIYGTPLTGEELTVATVTTNATSAMVSGINTVSVSGSGLILVSGSTPMNLSTDGTTPASTEVKVTVYSAFASGTVTIKLGNLTKVISVVRAGSNLVAFGMTTSMDYHTGNQYTSATIGSSASSWLSVSTDGTNSRGSAFTQSNASGFLPVYFISQDNPEGSPARQSDDIYLTQRDGGRVKVFVKQSSLVYTQIYGYIGTFHRWNQTGERIIRMNNSVGNWTALILSGSDFIKMDTEGSSRAYPLSGDAESNQVNGNNKVVRGVSTASVPIHFRVGITGTHPSGSAAGTGGTAVPRYGLIALAYADNTKIHLIHVRQGEASSVINSTAKWSPYNLSDPLRGLGGLDIANHSLFTPRAAVGTNTFSDYPTHVGYMFRWNTYNPTTTGSNRVFSARNPSATNDAGSITGYPSTTVTTWNTANDPCPKGYRHPTSAEFVTFALADLSNSYWGYYADGFFDRLTSGSSGVTGAQNYMYGTYGRLFYNSSTKASVFFPVAGNRIGSSGYLQSAALGCYSSSNYSSNVKALVFSSSSIETENTTYGSGRAFSVRCVAE